MTTTTKTHARADLQRSVPFTVVRDAEGNGDGLTFEGYGAVFNSPTRIDSWEGTFDEQFAPGAFRKSLRERTPKFQFDHGRHPLIGSVPIGKITAISEDERGLHVESRLGRHIIIDLIREAIESGAIDGMSIRFTVVREEWRDKMGVVVPASEVDHLLWSPDERGPLLRTITEAKLDEVGPVVWPAYQDTTASVRSAEPVTIAPDRLHEPEQRKMLAELLLRAESADSASPPDSGGSSEDEPQDTADQVAVEHSDEDTEPPQGTATEAAAEHGSDSPTEEAHPAPTDDVDAARSAETDRLFAEALAEVANTRDATPPII
ncbi:HK97 family phage prohead protease [Gordonia sp. OPL2]|uniref:HK97 family phage prohead protease n=1 Tax=Gordonia sp. OPL2 TaxID=2486274 RepID=UPI001655C896|nr:HK97 family phage prohead protease [Gordonia sp. OPL2]ROZ89005.1 HK97 family phage prohead protease [Gordonia sp. OPL2]